MAIVNFQKHEKKQLFYIWNIVKLDTQMKKGTEKGFFALNVI